MHELEGYVPEWLLTVTAVLVVLVTVAATAKRRPVRNILQGIGWIFSRLVGEPIGNFLHVEFTERAAPIIANEVERAVVPIRADIIEVRADLSGVRNIVMDHMAEEMELVADVNAALGTLGQSVGTHIREDREAFARIEAAQTQARELAKEAANHISDELATLNESTVGQLASADEARRIEGIPEEDRTAQERRHVQDWPSEDD